MTPPKRVLVSALPFGEFDPTPLRRLEEAGYQAVLASGGTPEWEKALVDSVGIVAGVERLGAAELERAKNLKVLSRCGTGMDSVDQEAAKRLGIVVRNTPDAPTEAVAEIALGLILCSLRGIAKSDRLLRAGTWSAEKGFLLREKTVGVVGLGRIGRRFVEILRPFATHVLVFDPNPNLEFATANGVEIVPALETIFENSDIISLHLPYAPNLRHMIHKGLIDRMKPHALLVNTARGPLVDEKALVAALKENRIGGAALDTFETEPYRGPLAQLDNVVLTAHMASYARECRVRMEMESVVNLLDALAAS